MSPRWEPNPDVRAGRHVECHLHAHLVFLTKYRRGALTGPMLSRCEEIMREVCADFEVELREFNGQDDHVHLLVHYPPKIALSKLVNSLKGVSARILRKEFSAHVRDHQSGDRTPAIHRTTETTDLIGVEAGSPSGESAVPCLRSAGSAVR